MLYEVITPPCQCFFNSWGCGGMKIYRLVLPGFVALLVAGAFWAGTRFSGTPAQPPGGSDKRQVLYS